VGVFSPPLLHDVVAKTRVDLVQYLAAVIEGPHLADGLVTNAGQNAADVV
jgi:hypothetical protein